MSKRYPRAKWVLPEVIDPDGEICYIVRVPNERFHIAAFLGALQNLASASQWADDSAHKARQVALVWRDVVDNLEKRACETLAPCVREIGGDVPMGLFRQEGCKLQFSIDGECWCTIYDPSECIAEAVTQDSDNQGDLAPGECREFDVVLQGNGRWVMPVAVNGGYTVVVTGATGGWYDGFEIAWRCPNGNGYVFGTCSGASTLVGTDPNPDVPHMRLVAKVGNEGTFDAYNTAVNIPPGSANEQVEFFANDSDLSDNAGSISFHVEVCNQNAGTWTQTFDFTNGEAQGWTPITDPTTLTTFGEIVSGGWQGLAPDADTIILRSIAFATRRILTATIYITEAMAGDRNDWYGFAINGGNPTYSVFTTDGASVQETWNANADMTQIMIGIERLVGPGTYAGKLWKFVITGEGSNPFA